MRCGTASLSIVLGLGLLALTVPADAHTCASACNQIRRACVRSAKATRDVARDTCDNERTACQAACVADPLSCPDGDSCGACCDDRRDACLAAAEDARQARRAVCDAARVGCNDVCVDPIDGTCVRGCRAEAQHDCIRPARRAAVQCKRLCTTGTGRRACTRACRRQFNIALGGCLDREVLCLADDCLGVPAP
jgi:hypothetical protein